MNKNETETTVVVEKSEESLGFEHDASPTWNGFNYQGKVGLYITLKKINESDECLKNLKNYSLEYEQLEDFSILFEEEYVSIHQVKAYKSNKINSYSEAIWKLLAKLVDKSTIQAAYLHNSTKIENWCTSSTIEDLYNETSSKLKDKVSEKYTDKKFTEIFNKFSLYDYSYDGNSNEFCDFFKIIELIKEELYKVFKIKNESHATDLQVETAYTYLNNLVDENISQRHSAIQKKESKRRIKFEDIYNIATYIFENPSDELIINLLKNKLEEFCTEYLTFLEDHRQIESIILFIENIRTLSNDEFMKFCLKITPNINIRATGYNNLEIYRQCLQRDGMYYGFLNILSSIEGYQHNSHCYIKKSGTANLSYLPSTIISNPMSDKMRESEINTILRNPNPDMFNEIDKIINTHIDIEKLESNNVHKIQSSQSIFDSSKKVTQMKDISLISFEKAKKELNE